MGITKNGNNLLPKGIYATLVALQTAFPTGTSGGYVVTADGKWYYWIAGAWTAGPTFQTAVGAGTVTTAMIDATLTNTIAQNKLLYSFTNEATLNKSNANGGVVDTVAKTITVPSGQTGQNTYLKFSQNFNGTKYVGQTIRLHLKCSSSSSALTVPKISLYMNVLRSGSVISLVGTNLIRQDFGSNNYYLTTDYVVQAGDTRIDPYVNIWSGTGLSADSVLTIQKMSYEIIPASTDLYTNNYILEEYLKKVSPTIIYSSTTNNYNNTPVIYNTSLLDKVFVQVTFVLEATFRVYGLMSDNVTYTLLPLVNLKTGNPNNVITTTGNYYVDTRGFSNIKFVNTNGNVDPPGTSSILAVSVYSRIEVPEIPLRIMGYNYSSDAPTPVLNSVTPYGALLAIKDGKLYSSVNEIIHRSSNWGADSFSEVLGTVTGATVVYKLRILDNGNAVAWGTSGKVYISIDGLMTWTLLIDMGIAPTHPNFGVSSYKNYLMFGQYTNVIDAGSKCYISEDYGVTVRQIFDIFDQPGYVKDGVNKRHFHSCAIDPYETTSDGKPMLWITTGDTDQNTWWSKDFGVTWNSITARSFGPIKMTEIIPFRNCVLFLTDSRIVSVIRYNRPITGTYPNQTYGFEIAKLFYEGWGKDALTDVPFGSTAGIDYVKSKAYFGFGTASNAYTGNITDDTLLKGQVYATDGYKFYEIYKNTTVINGLGVYSVFGPDSSGNVISRIDGSATGAQRFNTNMWP